ncbi:MAG TPA: ATP-binding protein [Methyloceanibacter sp.]|nr:ATP-binding protein [Methyloceanibacter sp.]
MNNQEQEPEVPAPVGAWLAPSVMGVGLAVLSWLAVGAAPLLLLLPLILAMVFAFGLVAILRRRIARDAKRLNALAQHLDGSLESLNDLKWSVREREARYRGLLDRQGDVIIRRRLDGVLSFANDAFCRVFGVKRDQALGEVFALPFAGDQPRIPELRFEAGEQRRNRVIELSTTVGPRWFVWEDFAVTDQSGRLSEIQSAGHDVTQQREAELALEEARDHAMSASQAKSRFLASMSHEIRTPMNGILGMTGLLLDTELSPEQSTYARAISTSAMTLLTLIDEVLDFSKIEAGKIELRPAPFEIADAAQSVIELLAPRARDKGLEICWLAYPDVPRTVIGDEMRIRQVLMNLLGNAIKFTEQGGVALVLGLSPEAACEADRVRLRLTVRDTGPGVPLGAIDRIFAEFEQADSGPTRRHGGTGLGLTISKKLIEEMGGTIAITSVPGEGASFTVDLPFGLPATTAVLSEEWPRPSAHERVLLALGGVVEANLAGELLVSLGTRVASTAAEDAVGIASTAEATDFPFTGLLTDLAHANAARQLIGSMRNRRGDGRPPRAVVILDPAERGEIPRLREQGFTGYLVRPIRPLSLLTQLFGSQDADTSDTADIVTLASIQFRAPGEGDRALSVLLAEDNDINALLARTVLEKCGARVVRARNGIEAIAAARHALEEAEGDTFDLVLMDIHMPEMDGIEAAQHIRALYADGAEAPGSRPPIVALTANAFAEDRVAYLQAGLDDYLAKPFEKDDLIALIARWRKPAKMGATGLGAA